MKTKHFLLTLFILSPFLNAKSDSIEVTVQVISNKLNESSNIYIVGNKSELGVWHPDRVKLERRNNCWGKSFKFDLNTELEFKFTQGSWETEALDNEGNIPSNHVIKIKQDTTLTYVINHWKSENSNFPINGRITGQVSYHNKVTYNGLLPRDIIVWLPPGYETDLEKKYPVLYMHDGQNIFDPTTSYTKVDWQVDESADSLINKNKIPPMIIVGINNTAERTAEYAPSETNKIYKKFVVEKLKPLIDSTYRTLPEREYTYVGGSSYGGTISFMLLWEHSDVFSKAACFSPAFITNFFNYVEQIDTTDPSNKIEVYLDNGGVGLEAQLQPGIDLMIKMLENKGFQEAKDYWFVLDKEAEHTESAWAKRVPNMLNLLFSH